MILVLELKYDIQKRRQKKLLELRKKLSVPYGNRHFPSRFTVQLIVSMALLFIVYFSYLSDHQLARISQEFIRESLTREYNFKGLYRLYQEKFKGFPAILPTFQIKEREEEHAYSFSSPIKNVPIKMVESNQGIYLKTVKDEPVRAIEQGLVIKIADDENHGKTVSVRHQNGIESTYAMLNRVDVEKDEWVIKGQNLGSVDQMLYLSIQNQEQVLNPMEVISFD